MLKIIAAAALAAGAQAETPFTVFDRTIPGWNVARRPDGCFAFTEGGAATVNVFYNVTGGEHSLGLLFNSPDWRLREEVQNDYALNFIGSGNSWRDLAAQTFQSDDDGTTYGVVAITFDAGSITAMLADIGNASSVVISHDGRPTATIGLANGERAMARLLACVRTVTDQPVPPAPTPAPAR